MASLVIEYVQTTDKSHLMYASYDMQVNSKHLTDVKKKRPKRPFFIYYIDLFSYELHH